MSELRTGLSGGGKADSDPVAATYPDRCNTQRSGPAALISAACRPGADTRCQSPEQAH